MQAVWPDGSIILSILSLKIAKVLQNFAEIVKFV